LNRSGELGVPAGQDQIRNHLDTPNFSGSRSQDISGLNSGNSPVKDTDSSDNGEVSASTSARSADFPSTRCLRVTFGLVSGPSLFLRQLAGGSLYFCRRLVNHLVAYAYTVSHK